ncbi:MAG: hydrogenase maturation protease [Acidobacteriota bacterium]|nr:hydrogenase maturation protease [Acidobacteriota bacterium]
MPGPSADPTPADGPAALSLSPTRVLVGGVGYRLLRDLSLGPLLMDRLRSETWPEGVDVEDLGYGPIGVMHNLDARPPYDRIVLVGGVKRGRTPGEVFRYVWSRRLPDDEEIQARVAEAITGVISLDNLLIIATYFGKLPPDVVVIEVEAAEEDWGEEFSEPVLGAIPQVIAEIRRCVAGAMPS